MVPADDAAARKLFKGDDLGLTFYTQLGIASHLLSISVLFLVKTIIWPWMGTLHTARSAHVCLCVYILLIYAYSFIYQTLNVENGVTSWEQMG